jgi:YbbR domain-containing protein
MYKIIKKILRLININLGGNMDFKSFLIGFLLALVVFLMVGAGGGNESSKYQIRDESNSTSATIIDTQTGIAKKIQKGRVVETYNFNAE